MKQFIFILLFSLNILSVVATTEPILTVEESKVSYLCFLNELAYGQLREDSRLYRTPFEMSHIKNIDMDYYAKSNLYRKRCDLSNSEYSIDLIDYSYQYDLKNDKIERNKFSAIYGSRGKILDGMLGDFAEFAKHVDWSDYNKQCDDSFIHAITDSLKLKEMMQWQNAVFQTQYNYHFKLSRFDLTILDFCVEENDLYVKSGLLSKGNTADVSMAIFRASCCGLLREYVLPEEERTFPFLLMSLSLKFCDEFFHEDFLRLYQPPAEDPVYMGIMVFNSHKFHRFYDSFDSFFKNQKLSVVGLKEFLAKYVADENPRIFAMVDYNGSTLQKNSIRIDIVTESTGILYSYKGEKCFAQPFEYTSKVDKNNQNIRHCKIKKVMAQSPDFLSFKVSNEFTITDDSELNFRFRRGGKKCSYRLKLKVLTEEEVRMEM